MAFQLFDFVLLGVGLAAIWRLAGKKNAHLPPGPKGLPLVGNALQLPKENEWLVFAEWARKWGPIMSLSALGRQLIIISSAQIMEELDKKGAIYSDRPVLPMGGQLVGYDQTIVLLPYGSRWRTYRKYFARVVGPGKAVQSLHPLIDEEAKRFLKRVAVTPDDLLKHLRKLAGGVILGAAYGYKVQEEADPFVTLVEKANDNFSAATTPGAFLVDFFPSLLKLPEWLPGMGFIQTARRWKKDTVAMTEVPYEYTVKQMAAATAPPSFISTHLEDGVQMSDEEIYDLKWAAGSMYGAGADTTVSAEYAFFLAMVLHPEVQKKAQAEIDAVVGADRLPTWEDRPNLPYVGALVTEVLRWNSVAPLGIPHVPTEDGYIGGHFVPKGALIIANLWAMLHDPALYPRPFEFDPERHIPGPGREVQYDPRKICFGYARRVCPGLALADASLFSCVVLSLAAFNIEKALDVNGIPIIPVHENTNGTISFPKTYKCSIKPRSSKILSLL